MLDSDDPEPRAFQERERPNAGSMRHKKLKVSSPMLSSPPEDLSVVHDPVLTEEEVVLAVFELVGPGGERFEEGAWRDRVTEKARPASQTASPWWGPC